MSQAASNGTSATASSGYPHALLATLQLADSFFPTGMFTQSHGLESFVSAGVTSAAALEPVLHSYLIHVAALGDALAARWVLRAAGNLELIAQIDTRLEATKLAAESRRVSRRCGGRVLLLGADVFGGATLRSYAAQVAAGQAPGHQSVALALVAAAAGLDEDSAVSIELHSFAVSLVGAAIRLGVIDHNTAQRLLLRAHPIMAQAAEIGTHMDWHDIGGFAPHIELMQFQHATALMHMFTS